MAQIPILRFCHFRPVEISLFLPLGKVKEILDLFLPHNRAQIHVTLVNIFKVEKKGRFGKDETIRLKDFGVG